MSEVTSEEVADETVAENQTEEVTDLVDAPESAEAGPEAIDPPAAETEEQMSERIASEHAERVADFSDRVSDEDDEEEDEDDYDEEVRAEAEAEAVRIAGKLAALSPKIESTRNSWEYHKSAASKLKKDLDKLHEKSDELLEELADLDLAAAEEEDPQRQLPFDDDDDEPAAPAAKRTVVDPAIKRPVHELGLTDSQVDNLMDAGVQFIAQLEKRIADANAGGWSWTKGINRIGPEAATKIEDAILDWRKENPVPDPDEEPEVLEAVAVDSDGDLKPVDSLEEASGPDASVIAEDGLIWKCAVCESCWVDGDKCGEKCVSCGNEEGNHKLGYYGNQDVDESGQVRCGFETVDLVASSDLANVPEVGCEIYLYETPDGDYLSGGDAIDTESGDDVSLPAMITSRRSKTSLGELFYQAGQLFDEVKSERLMNLLLAFRDRLVGEIGGRLVECTECETEAVHVEGQGESCRFCGGDVFKSKD